MHIPILEEVFWRITKHSNNLISLKRLVTIFRKGVCYKQNTHLFNFNLYFTCGLYTRLILIKLVINFRYMDVVLIETPISTELVFLMNSYGNLKDTFGSVLKRFGIFVRIYKTNNTILFGCSINVFDILTYTYGGYIDGGMGKIKQLGDFNILKYKTKEFNFGYYMNIKISS